MPTEVHSCTEQYTPGTNTVHGKYHTGAGGKLRAIAKGLNITARSTIDRGQVAHTENTTPGAIPTEVQSCTEQYIPRARNAQSNERTEERAHENNGDGEQRR